MPTPPTQSRRVRIACFVVAAAASGAAAVFAAPSRDAAAEAADDAAGVFSCETGGFRYEYHAPTGHEFLCDLSGDPEGLRNVLREREDVAVRCRRTLEERLNVRSLDSLRARYGGTIRRLRALGYL